MALEKIDISIELCANRVDSGYVEQTKKSRFAMRAGAS